MCYRVATPKEFSEVEKEFQAKVETPELYKAFHHLNGFAGLATPIITTDNPQIIRMADWKSHDKFNSLNAKSEEIFQEKKYYKSFTNRRAIMAVEGFYESYELKKQGKKIGDKFPYFIYLENKKCFGLACLLSHFNTISILTTSANGMMKEIHNNAMRMPVILHKSDYALWLSNDLMEDEMLDVMRPYDDQQMSAYPVSKLIYDKKQSTDVVDVKNKFDYKEAALPVFKNGIKLKPSNQLDLF